MCLQSMTLYMSDYTTTTPCGANLLHSIGFVNPASWTATTLTWTNKPSIYTAGASFNWPLQSLTQSSSWESFTVPTPSTNLPIVNAASTQFNGKVRQAQLRRLPLPHASSCTPGRGALLTRCFLVGGPAILGGVLARSRHGGRVALVLLFACVQRRRDGVQDQVRRDIGVVSSLVRDLVFLWHRGARLVCPFRCADTQRVAMPADRRVCAAQFGRHVAKM